VVRLQTGRNKKTYPGFPGRVGRDPHNHEEIAKTPLGGRKGERSRMGGSGSEKATDKGKGEFLDSVKKGQKEKTFASNMNGGFQKFGERD